MGERWDEIIWTRFDELMMQLHVIKQFGGGQTGERRKEIIERRFDELTVHVNVMQHFIHLVHKKYLEKPTSAI